MFENIRTTFPNFCIGPQVGTFCTVNVENEPITMSVKNNSGTLIRNYSFNPSTTLEPGPYYYSSSSSYVAGSTFNAKSIIIDIADAWATSSWMAIRAIDFYDEEDNLIDLDPSEYTSYATSFYGNAYLPEFVFNTSLVKIGTIDYTSWLSGNGNLINQRLICVFNTTKDIKKIVINNGHRNGGYVVNGVKNIKIYYSKSLVTNTSFAMDTEDYHGIFDGQIPTHIEEDIIDDYDLPLSTNSISAHNEFVAIKYIGPSGQSSFYNGAIFYTLERSGTGNRTYYTYTRYPEPSGPYIGAEYDSLATGSEVEYSGNIIRRWILDADNFQLDLESSYYMNSDSTNWFGGKAFAIDNLQTELDGHVSIGTGILELTTTSGLSKYDKILIGPSSDATNPGVVEEVYIHAISGNDITIRTYSGYIPTKYEYIAGDSVTIFKDMLLFSNPKPLINSSNIRYGFQRQEGTLYTLSQSDYGAVIDTDYNAIYADVDVAIWNNSFNTLSFVKGQNLLHLDTYTYTIIKSQLLLLTEPTDADIIPIYDLDIRGADIYKLQEEILQRNDDGVISLVEWDTYNYSIDTLNPYTHSVTVYPDTMILGYQGVTDVIAVVRDQYGVGLLSKNILFYVTGDVNTILVPYDGIAVTDSDGICSIQYTAGTLFKERSIINAKADGGNTVHGSAYLVGKTFVPTYPDYTTDHYIVNIDNEKTGDVGVTTTISSYTGNVNMLCFVRRSFPGGEWVWNGVWDDPSHPIINPTIEDRNQDPTDVSQSNDVSLITTVYQPIFNQVAARYEDGELIIEDEDPLPNVRITQLDSMYSEYNTNITSINESDDERYLSQNYLSRHLLSGHIVTSTINQYVFIQEARPVFWSEKNPTSIDYWVRLRPFSSSLDPSTLKITVYETSYLGTTSPVNIVPLGTTSIFDAGGGLDGVEFVYVFPVNFHHNAVIYVEIEIYDQAVIPNLLLLNYWFKIVPDYRHPYFINQNPSIEEANVNIDTPITFDVLDVGEGVDITTLEIYINNQSTTFTYSEYEYGQYNIECILPKIFHYGQEVSVSVMVGDRAENNNIVRDGWIFYCTDSTGPWFNVDDVAPGKCLEGVNKESQDVSLQVYGINNTGIDYDSLKLEVGGKYRNIKVTPIIYRLK